MFFRNCKYISGLFVVCSGKHHTKLRYRSNHQEFFCMKRGAVNCEKKSLKPSFHPWIIRIKRTKVPIFDLLLFCVNRFWHLHVKVYHEKKIKVFDIFSHQSHMFLVFRFANVYPHPQFNLKISFSSQREKMRRCIKFWECFEILKLK